MGKQVLKRLALYALCVLAIAALFTFESFAEEQTLTVTLSENPEDGLANYRALRDAAESAAEGQSLTIVIERPGTYLLSSTSNGGIKLRSNTTLDLNGSTLKRSETMHNLIQVCDYAGDNQAGGYDLAENITIKNGVLDGNENTKTKSNVVNIGHSRNINLLDLTVKNSAGHLVELTGCEDCTVQGCTFSGFVTLNSSATDDEDTDDSATEDSRKTHEALQLDTPGDVSAKHWNGTYFADNTPCRNITVDGCTFLDFPSGVGDHKSVYTAESSGITIQNCTFANSLNTDSPAVWFYAFKDSVIKDNIVTGNYSEGFLIRGGSCTVSGNRLGAELSPLKYTGIKVTYVKCYLIGQKDVYTGELGCENTIIRENEVYTDQTGETPCIIVSPGVVTEICNNTFCNQLTDAESSALIISGENVQVGSIYNNTITSKNGAGLKIAAKAKVTGTVYSNTVTSKSYGISVTSGASVAAVGGAENYRNTISSSAESINISGGTITNVSYNTVSSSDSHGVFVHYEGTLVTFRNNTVTAAGNALRVSGKSTVSIVSENGLSSAGDDCVYVTEQGSTINTFSSNTLESAAGGGLYCTKGTVNTVSGNTFGAVRPIKTTAVSFVSSAVCGNITSNSIAATSVGVNISGAQVSNVSNNTVNSVSSNGVFIHSAGTLTTFRKNNVTAAGNALRLSGKGFVKTASENTLSSGTEDCVYVTEAGSKIESFTSNTLSAAKKGGLYCTKGAVGTVKSNVFGTDAKHPIKTTAISFVSAASCGSITSNTVYATSMGVNISGAAVTTVSENTVNSASSYGVFVHSAGTLTTLSKNTVASSDNALRLSGKGVVKTVSANKLSSKTADCVYLTEKGSKIESFTSNTLSAAKKGGLYCTKAAVGTVKSNYFGTDSKHPVKTTALSFVSAASCGSVTSNKIYASSMGVNISGATVTEVSGNTIQAASYGCFIHSSGKLTTMKNNTVTASDNALRLSGKGVVKTASANKLTSKTADGVYITGAGSKIETFSSNTVKAEKKGGLYCTQGTVTTLKNNVFGSDSKRLIKTGAVTFVSSSVCGSIVSNKIYRPGENGIYISNATVTKISSNTVSKAGKNGIHINSAKVKEGITSNTVTSCGENGISLTGSHTVKTITKNTVKSCNIGIKVSKTSNKMTVTGNVLKKNKTALSVAAKGTIQTK